MNKILKVVFNLKILPSQIPHFKREILYLQHRGADVWHNHVVDDICLAGEHKSDLEEVSRQGKNYRRYPRIQYRIEKLQGQYFACLWGIAEGAEALEEFIYSGKLNQFSWMGKNYILRVQDSCTYRFNYPKMLNADNLYPFTLTHFLPFNERRYQEFKSFYLFCEKLELIELLIRDHISLLAEQLAWADFNSEQLIVRTLDLKGFNTVKYIPNQCERSLRFVSVDMKIGLNCQMPPGIAIGNMTSLGYGILRPARQKQPGSLPNVL
ncbi:MAG: hypothetical protein V9E90_03255 [Saprospiraceae bacterium]